MNRSVDRNSEIRVTIVVTILAYRDRCDPRALGTSGLLGPLLVPGGLSDMIINERSMSEEALTRITDFSTYYDSDS